MGDLPVCLSRAIARIAGRQGEESLGARRGGNEFEHTGERGARSAVSLGRPGSLDRESTHPRALGEDDPLRAGSGQRLESLQVFRE